MGREARRLLAVGVVVFVWLLLAGGVLQALGFLVGLLVAVGLLCGLVWLTDESAADRGASTRPSGESLSRIEVQIAQQAAFTRAVSQLQSTLTRQAQREALASINELDAL